MLRHTAATLMLANGADVRLIQEFLGHRDLSTTALYTKVNITQLKAIHSDTHPSAKLPLPGVPEEDGGSGRGQNRPRCHRPVAKTQPAH